MSFTDFVVSAKRASAFKSAGDVTSVLGVRISGSNAGYTMFRGSVTSTGYPLHLPVSPSQCAITFQLESNAGYTMFRGSVKSTGYPLHSPVSPSLPLPCVTVYHHVSTGIYTYTFAYVMVDCVSMTILIESVVVCVMM